MTTKVWADNPVLQARYEKILADQRQLQQSLGVEPKTLEQRWQELQQRQQREAAARAELEQQLKLARLQSIPKPSVSLRRPGK